jgi:hypothetical protein
MQTPISPLRKRFNWNNGFAIGATLSSNPRMSGIGLTGVWQLNNHISVNVGIEKSETQRGRFRDDNDFKDKTDKEFRKLFDQGVPQTTQFKDIEFRNHAWSLPVAVQYRTAAWKGFSAIGSLGLAFSLENQNRFNYVYTPPVGSDATGTLQQNDETVGFVDRFSVGLGLQKDWRKWTIQVLPTFNAPISMRDDDDKPNPTPDPKPGKDQPHRDFGFIPLTANVRLLYNF